MRARTLIAASAGVFASLLLCLMILSYLARLAQ